MKITTFKNRKGIIHGSNTKRIRCDKSGVLTIGDMEITVTRDAECVLPLLFHGSTGNYSASFTDSFGTNYDLGTLLIRGGRITPPSSTEVEFMELRCRADVLEDEVLSLRNEIAELRNIFDTNSLNFLIKS